MRFRFLLRPGWLALTLVVLMFAIACYTLLAPWQFRRNAERVAQNTAVSTSLRTAPVPIDQAFPAGTSTAAAEWRPVTMTGRYLPAGEALARLRTVQGEAAFEVLTPFQLAQGGVVLVNRGYVRPVGDVSVPPFAAPPTGEVTVTARARQDEGDRRDAFTDDGHRQVYTVDSQTVGRAAGLGIRPGYFQLVDDQPGVLNALPLPQLDSGPFFSYALQWIAFGSMAILAWIYFTWREAQPGGVLAEQRPQRRRSVAEVVAEEEAMERAGFDQPEEDEPQPRTEQPRTEQHTS